MVVGGKMSPGEDDGWVKNMSLVGDSEERVKREDGGGVTVGEVG